ncbi:hypothetical protein M413DRAFT_448638 [Hebeloma cylindrosporum]|uniref:Uncharacterized protein n=1 Tax=Hebeloma cylindrosporum TaxID=76867 RepID=A0A0C2XHL3_HEBCY|nr:hypothetical protein M413DRAFT_448638 [Hebeloma cylindrosporum h7]
MIHRQPGSYLLVPCDEERIWFLTALYDSASRNTSSMPFALMHSRPFVSSILPLSAALLAPRSLRRRKDVGS